MLDWVSVRCEGGIAHKLARVHAGRYRPWTRAFAQVRLHRLRTYVHPGNPSNFLLGASFRVVRMNCAVSAWQSGLGRIMCSISF